MDEEVYYLPQCKKCKHWKDYYENDIPSCILTMSNDSGNCLSFEPKTQKTNKEKKDANS